MTKSLPKSGLTVLAITIAMSSLPAPSARDFATAVKQTPLDEREILYDGDGLIIHEDGGGDTAQREGWYWLGVWLRANTPGLKPWPNRRKLNFDQVLKLLEPKGDGVFYRHPKMAPYNNPFDKEFGFSRDQMVPLVAAMGVWGKKAALKRLWDALPEDLVGKHAFNGNWRNFLGQDGANCSEIKKRGCDATADCSLKADNRDCSLQTDTRDCSLKTDNTDCSLQQDTRGCNRCILWRPGWPLGDGGCAQEGNDPVCEAAKATQNAAYAAAKASCEAGKSAKNLGYKAEHDACEAAKAGQNVLYKQAKDACEAGKASQNALYGIEKASCELGKTLSKAGCEAQKAVDQLGCFVTNFHNGDIIGPQTVNLFRRAMGENPLVPLSSALVLPPVNIGTGLVGESELAINVRLRLAIAAVDKDNTGDDLNLIVSLLMARLRFPSPTSEASNLAYLLRPHSYGSYLRAYRQKYGDDANLQRHRIEAGIRNENWQPEVTAPLGAAKWYHRADTGGNPLLAEMYGPIIDHYLIGGLRPATR